MTYHSFSFYIRGTVSMSAEVQARQVDIIQRVDAF